MCIVHLDFRLELNARISTLVTQPRYKTEKFSKTEVAWNFFLFDLSSLTSHACFINDLILEVKKLQFELKFFKYNPYINSEFQNSNKFLDQFILFLHNCSEIILSASVSSATVKWTECVECNKWNECSE